MNAKAIAAILSSLATAPLVVGCAKSQATQAPASGGDANPAAGEHACGNHAEGACGSGAPDEGASTSRSFSIAPGEFAEVNFQMSAGSTVVVTFSGGADDIAWDVHSHGPSGEAQVHDSGQGGVGNIEFEAPTTGVFSVLWKNAGSAATPLEVRVAPSDGAGIHSWMPAP